MNGRKQLLEAVMMFSSGGSEEDNVTEKIQNSEKYLNLAKEQNGFSVEMLRIIVDSSIPFDFRFACAYFMKNFILDSYYG